MSEFNLELFTTLILNYAYIDSKRRETGMFTLYHQVFYPNKSNSSPPILQSISGVLLKQATKKENERFMDPLQKWLAN